MWGIATEPPRSCAAGLGRLVGWLLPAAGLLAASMGSLTYSWSGRIGLASMGVAMLIAFASNLAGAVPACRAFGRGTAPAARDLLGGMLLRNVVLVLIAVPMWLSDLLPAKPFLLWLAGAYFVFLMVETTLLAGWVNRRSQVQS